MSARAEYPSDLYTLIKAVPDFVESLTPLECMVLRYDLECDLLVRPEQRVPRRPFRSFGAVCGRGWGKSWLYGREFNRRVMRGESKMIALVGPNDERTRQVCVRFLIAESPPWFKAYEDRGGVSWPNGAHADVHTAEIEEIRGPGYDTCWLTELAFWPANTRRGCYENVTTTTRDGARQIFWDTTVKGKNDLILDRLAEHERNPEANIVIRGTIFDNEWYDRVYLESEWRKYGTGRRRDEELLGMVFPDADGALWKQDWLDAHRRQFLPLGNALTLVSLDPATTAGPRADAFGFVVASLVNDDVFITRDRSERMKPEVWGPKVIEEYERGAAGVVVEVTGNSGGDSPLFVIRTCARDKGYEVVEWPVNNDKPMPPRANGKIYVREVQAHERKEDRAEPAAVLTERGRVHLVGEFETLEEEMTTWIPGTRKSPNRLDAAARAIIELSGVTREKPAQSVEQAINTAHDAHAALRAELARRAGKRTVT
jgi:phage terminase large subunit-like protein